MLLDGRRQIRCEIIVDLGHIGSHDLAHDQYFIFDIWFFIIIIESRHISLYKLCIMTCKNNWCIHLILSNRLNHYYIKEINVLMKCYFMAIDQSDEALHNLKINNHKRLYISSIERKWWVTVTDIFFVWLFLWNSMIKPNKFVFYMGILNDMTICWGEERVR